MPAFLKIESTRSEGRNVTPRATTGARRALVALAAVGALVASPDVVRADEPLLLGIEAGVAVPLASPQSERFGAGGTLGLALHVPLSAWLAPVVRARGLLLSDGAAPAEPGLRDPGPGAAWALAIGLRLRPSGLWEVGPERATGPWVEVDAGGALTGELLRPAFEAAVGWDFDADDARVGPVARFVHVVHFDDQLDDRGAYLLLAGVEVVLFDRRAQPAPEPEAPVGDRDGDGLRDDRDGCPDQPEDADNFEDEDGCPDLDDDHDGIADGDDECRREPEDRDGFEDEDGCPELDDDRDGFLDPQDACPRDAEILNGVEDDDGCPDEGLISMIDDRIVLEERVLFDFQRARVKHAARPVLAAIVELWRQHPEWERVRVEGHADTRGETELNQVLSERRARRVRDVLVEMGMPIEMIEVVGFGASRPRDAGDSEEAHQRNRRVEFVVISRREVAADGEETQ